MSEYQKPYLELFNSFTNVIEELKEIQRKAEELFISAKSEITK